MQKKNKKEISELKRLESLKQRENLYKQKSLSISNSLKEITKKPKLTIIDESINEKNNLILFKDDSDLSDYDEAFNIKNINIKNKSLQFQKQVNDNRFKLDENFLDEEDSNIINEEKLNSFQDEKLHSLSILNSIISVKPIKTTSFKDIEQLRYDPDARDHKKFEVGMAIKDTKVTNSKVQPNKSSIPVSSKKRFCEISSDLKDSLKSDRKFNLSVLFEDDEDDNDYHKKDMIVSMPKEIQNKNIFSDSSEDEDSLNQHERTIIKTLQTIANIKDTSKFFFAKDDLRLATNFYRTNEIEALKTDWSSNRQYYVDSYRKRKKYHRAISKTNKLKL